MLCLPVELQKAVIADLGATEAVGAEQWLRGHTPHGLILTFAAVARTCRHFAQMVLEVGLGSLDMADSDDRAVWARLARTDSGKALIQTVEDIKIIRRYDADRLAFITSSHALAVGCTPHSLSVQLSRSCWSTLDGVRGHRLRSLELSNLSLAVGWEHILIESRATLVALEMRGVRYNRTAPPKPLRLPELPALRFLTFFSHNSIYGGVDYFYTERAICAAATSQLEELQLCQYGPDAQRLLLLEVGEHLAKLTIQEYIPDLCTLTPNLTGLCVYRNVPKIPSFPTGLEDLRAAVDIPGGWVEYFANGHCKNLQTFRAHDVSWNAGVSNRYKAMITSLGKQLAKRKISFEDQMENTIDTDWLDSAERRNVELLDQEDEDDEGDEDDSDADSEDDGGV